MQMSRDPGAERPDAAGPLGAEPRTGGPLDRATRHWEPASDTPDSVAEDVDFVLRTAGVVTALGLLNGRTRFRYTGLYRADPPVLRNLRLYDRENPALNVSGAVCSLDETYCSITAGGAAPFVTGDAPADPRLRGHAALASVLSYAGVPVRMPGGQVWGTLCHFDGRPRLLPEGELAVLEAAAPVFARWLREHEVRQATAAERAG